MKIFKGLPGHLKQHQTAFKLKNLLNIELNSNSNIKYESKLELKHQTECSSEKVVGATLAANAI